MGEKWTFQFKINLDFHIYGPVSFLSKTKKRKTENDNIFYKYCKVDEIS